MPEDDAAHRTGHKAHGKGGKGQDGADSGVKIREKDLVEDYACDHAVEEEVVPFDNGSDEGRDNDATQVFLLIRGGVFHWFSKDLYV